MKKSVLTSLTFFILFGFYACKEPAKIENMENASKNQSELKEIPDALSVIFSRKSVRQYTDEKVDKDTLELLVKAGMAAPTAGNRQPWAFLIIDDKEKLENMAEILPFGKMLSGAAAAIVVCGDTSKVKADGPAYWVQDCSAVTQNILLAVEAVGLGAVWIGVYPSEDRTANIVDYLSLPQNIIPLSVISIGHPAGDTPPKDKWDPEKVHWNEWK